MRYAKADLPTRAQWWLRHLPTWPKAWTARVRDALKRLQRQMKAGLTAGPSLGMYEVGFADREIAKDLGAPFPQVTNFNSARAWVRANGNFTRDLIAPFPAYFQTVLDEVLA